MNSADPHAATIPEAGDVRKSAANLGLRVESRKKRTRRRGRDAFLDGIRACRRHRLHRTQLRTPARRWPFRSGNSIHFCCSRVPAALQGAIRHSRAPSWISVADGDHHRKSRSAHPSTDCRARPRFDPRFDPARHRQRPQCARYSSIGGPSRYRTDGSASVRQVDQAVGHTDQPTTIRPWFCHTLSAAYYFGAAQTGERSGHSESAQPMRTARSGYSRISPEAS